jgi:hypothetical protein
MMALNFETITEDIGENISDLTKNKGGLLLLGAGAVLLFVVFRRPSAPVEETSAPVDISYEQTEQSRFAQFQSQVMQQVASNMNAIQSEIAENVNQNLGTYYGDITEQMNDFMEHQSEIGEESKEYIDTIRQELEKELGVDKENVEKKSSAGWTVGYGLHGENPNAGIDFRKDRDALKEEIERTQSVINYRKENKLNTEKQVEHLQALQGY